jgi:nucleoside-diphosphate-sugar epimerase
MEREMQGDPGARHVVFGAGPVGLAVATELAARGRRVIVVNRSGRAELPAGVERRGGDASDPAFAREVSAGASVVYDCLNPPYHRWPELFPPLQAGVLEGAAAAGARLVAMENLYLYGPNGGRPLTEDLPAAATSRKGVTRARMAEDLLAAHRDGRVRVAIGRASDFFGPGVVASAMGERVVRPALTGRRVQVIGDPDLPHTYSYVPDIGRALVLLGEREEALGQAWHLPSPPTVSTRRLLELLAAEAGQRARVQSLPRPLFRALGVVNRDLRELREMLYEFEEPFVADHGKFARAFGDLATPLEEAVGRTAAWYRSHPPRR